jgi:GTP-binding protein HflX
MVLSTGKADTERAFLIGLAHGKVRRSEVAESLDELAQLTRSAGASVIGQRIQTRPSPDRAYYIGRGLVDEIKQSLSESGGNCVIFDDPLSAAQQRNLEDSINTKVIDRHILILDIFATRARSAAARLQVELAQLEYTLPRLTGAWVHFSKQYGGIGAKGPGETQLEIDRRQVRKKIEHLKEKLKKLGVQRETQRKARRDMFKIALVGYTNSGKSTLFNILTKSDVTAANQLFTTLDSTTRMMSAGYPCRVIFSDTVGFIRKLPHQLVESFKSTLEEISQADLLLQVVDCSDPFLDKAMTQTRQVLDEIGAGLIPYLLIYNKIDVNPEFVALQSYSPAAFSVSALNRTGIAALQAEIVARASSALKPTSRP